MTDMDREHRCIYCGSSGPFNREHPLPRSFGEFKDSPFPRNRVCKTCNKKIGELEEQLGRSGPEAYFRKRLGIEGRSSHDKVDPFQRGSYGARPIDLIMRQPETGIPVLWSIDKGVHNEARQIVLIPEEGDPYPLRIADWMREPEDLRKAIRELKLGKIKSISVFYRDEDSEWVEHLMQGIGGRLVRNPKRQPTTITDEVGVRVTVTSAYFRAIAKVGFHYFLAVRPDIDCSRAEFDRIREYIMSGGSEEIVTCKRGTLPWRPPFYSQTRYVHVVVVEWSGGSLRALVQFFLGQDIEPPVYYCIHLAQGVAELQAPGYRSHCYMYYSSGPIDGYHGETIELSDQPLPPGAP